MFAASQAGDVPIEVKPLRQPAKRQLAVARDEGALLLASTAAFPAGSWKRR
jgi:hypothetical protein